MSSSTCAYVASVVLVLFLVFHRFFYIVYVLLERRNGKQFFVSFKWKMETYQGHFDSLCRIQHMSSISAWNSLFVVSSMGQSNVCSKRKSPRKCLIPFHNWKICGFRFPLIAPLIKLDCNYSVRVIKISGEASSFVINTERWIQNKMQIKCRTIFLRTTWSHETRP